VAGKGSGDGGDKKPSSLEWQEEDTDVRDTAGRKTRAAGDEEDTTRSPTIKREKHVSAALPSFVDAYLDVTAGPSPRISHKLTMTRTVIGRGSAADLALQDTDVSKQHATVFYQDAEFRVRDEKSTNGTFLNGSKVVEYAIRDGDKILVGDTLLRFRLGGPR
jgi:hypothetical protein